MLHLDTLVLHNFKSFKHANIKFTNGFNCIVGSNGSGKSSICDSLLFALGEGSLKRMHIPSFSYLINSSAKPRPEDGLRRAYVKLTLTNGTEQYEIMRAIKESKVGYRLNGKHVTRQEILDLLYHEQSEINDTNVITQGEIMSKIDLNAKERRELIDVASGIKEFDDKKAAAMKELEKVEAKISEARVMLNERIGFLEELKKEKEDAERYLELTSLLKRANFTLLKRREHALSEEYAKQLKEEEEKSKRIAAIDSEIKNLDIDIEKASAEKQGMLNVLNARSSETNEASKALEEINKQMALLEASIKASEARIGEMAERRKALSAESAKLESGLGKNRLSIESLSKELAAAQAELSRLELPGQAASSDSQGAYESNQKRLYDLNAKKESLIANKASIESFIARWSAQRESAENDISAVQSEASTANERLEKLNATMRSSNEELEMLNKKLNSIKLHIDSIRARTDENYRQSVDIRERLAMLGGSSSRISASLKGAKGFRGTAEELCTYEGKYAVAIQAAASGRMGYFVMDTIDDASKAIEILKSKNLGRATFIPIKELAVKGDTEHVGGAVPLISLVSFDKAYEKVFRYIFSNTFLVDDVGAAKSIGIGKHRFVTLEGEVIEPAGIISGGSMKESPAQLAARLKALESERAALEKDMRESSSEMESLGRSIAGKQAELLGLASEAKSAKGSIEAAASKASELKNLSKDIEKNMLEAKKELERIESEISSVDASISELRSNSDMLYAYAAGAHGAQSAKSASRIKELRSSAESLKIKIATASKENEMIEARMKSITNEIAAIDADEKAQRQEKQDAAQHIQKFSQDAKVLQEKIKSHDEKSAAVYKQITELDARVSQAAQQRGRLSSDIEKLRRDLASIEAAKAQAETRLNDIKAEFLSYGSVQELDKDTAELEKQLVLWKADIENLGAVNMKAPEIYEEKSRDVNEARQKISVLGSEKDSIISMMNEIDAKKLSVFTETFKAVNENFKKLYSYAFPDSGYLELEDSKDPFNSGLLIKVKGPNSKEKVPIVPSGGEKSLHMLMLLFAIQMCKPMSLYIFDEIDVALDKENTKKLSRVIKEISKKSQMIIVSHNDNMIVAADTAIGVTKTNGESRAFGIEVSALKANEQQAHDNSSR
ncbi:MAG: AAA family ATPase [Candidatus Marsarchaeota archaeon]|jgi:chromosome segregation protein|nr:AAA family ATPase [Candidatus Marsarchaeota archaeon]MCL5418632.1 AAA family ATPase [Candidatus Marsarchaeota archaeon]